MKMYEFSDGRKLTAEEMGRETANALFHGFWLPFKYVPPEKLGLIQSAMFIGKHQYRKQISTFSNEVGLHGGYRILSSGRF